MKPQWAYKDKTYCRHYRKCVHRDNCYRALTPEIRRKLKTAFLATFDRRPGCHEIEKNRSKKC